MPASGTSGDSLCSAPALALRALPAILNVRYRKHLLSVDREHLAECLGVRGNRTTLVVDHRERLAQGLSPIENAQRSKSIAIDAEGRRDDRDAVTCLSHGEKRMRGSTLEDIVGRESRKA